VKAAPNLGAAYVTLRNLLWRCDTNRDQGRIGRARIGAARRAAFAEHLRGIARRAAISRDQDFVFLALHRTAGYAIRFDDPDAGAGRASRALRTRGSGRTGGAGRTHRADIALGALRTGWAGVALRAFAAGSQAAGDARQQYDRECQMRCTHFQILPKCLENELLRPAKEDRSMT